MVGAILRETINGSTWRLDEGESWTIGRAGDCDVRIAFPEIGRRHTRVEYVNGGWRAVHLGSANPTLVNGVKVDREELRSGDVLQVGPTLLTFEWDGRPPRIAAPAARRESIPLPQAFESLMQIFSVAPVDVDGALVVARAGESLLRHAGDRTRRPALLEAYKRGCRSPWPVVRAVSMHGVTAILGIEEGTRDAAAKEITPLTEDEDTVVREAALRSLATLDPLAAAPKLHVHARRALSNLYEPDEVASRTAELIRAGDGELVDSLLAEATAVALDSQWVRARCAAIGALGEIAASGRAEAVRPLRALLAAESTRVRLASAHALGRAGTPESRDALLLALGDASPDVFQAAARGLAGHDDARVVDRLKAELAATPASDGPRRARYRRALEDVTGDRRGPDPTAWLR